MRSRNRRIDLETVMAELGRREILSVLLEAGPTLNGDALAAGVVHKLMLFYAPKIAGDNRVPLAFASRLSLSSLHNVRAERFGPDIAVEGYFQDVYRA
jgi:diaminohydroxyphosphoribosylaminopyrimidine deaminase/5-amino-6-(5-phosphoribosylamino)uracil reductase